MQQEHFYEVNIHWKEGRIGELSSPALTTIIECATPPEFPNGVPGKWSPEHLFAASVNSCYMATFLAIAHNFKLEIVGFDCRTVVRLDTVEGKYLVTAAEMFPELKLVHPETDTEKAMRVLDKAKAGCLITNSIKATITLHPTVC